MEALQAHDAGVPIFFHSQNSLVGAVVSAVILKPDGSTIEVALTVIDDLTAVYYTTGADFDLQGQYEIQLYADWGTGRVRHGKIARFDVGEIIQTPPA